MSSAYLVNGVSVISTSEPDYLSHRWIEVGKQEPESSSRDSYPVVVLDSMSSGGFRTARSVGRHSRLSERRGCSKRRS
jgi:hypothetical protein